MVFRVLGSVVLVMLFVVGCGDDSSSSGGGAGSGGANLCSAGAPNGVLEAGEQCDGTNFGVATCATLGMGGGVLVCTSGCEINTSMCAGGSNVGTAGM